TRRGWPPPRPTATCSARTASSWRPSRPTCAPCSARPGVSSGSRKTRSRHSEAAASPTHAPASAARAPSRAPTRPCEPMMRVGAVGVGVHAVNAILPSLPVVDLRLVATCARHLDRAQAVADRFGAASAFDDVERMLDTVELDGVVVVVPPDQFAPVIRACVRRGVAVFAEKPAANDAAEAAQLANEAAAAGVTVMVGYMKRFAYAYRVACDVMGD